MSEEEGNYVSFWPPLWQQRRYVVATILREHANLGIKSVMDLGTGEGKMLEFLKHEKEINLLIGVDVDTDGLLDAKQACEPKVADFLDFDHPLKIQLYKGSICIPDERLVGIDAAVCVEVIEHLPFEDLERFPEVVFGILQPKVLIISTPNSEFNVLFKGLEVGKFRHFDHKFEWTRDQFQQWSNSVASKYGYTVKFAGVGDPVTRTEDDNSNNALDRYGHCTQIGVFTKNSTTITNCTTTIQPTNHLELVASFEYPFKKISKEEQLHYELVYQYWKMSSSDSFDETSPDGFVPLSTLLDCYGLRRLDCSLETVLSVISSKPEIFQITDDKSSIKVDRQYSRSHSEESEDEDLTNEQESDDNSHSTLEGEDVVVWEASENIVGVV